MKHRKGLIIIIVGLITAAALPLYPYNTKGIVAYPVPFNPRKGTLTIADFSGVTFNKVKIKIFDINGGRIFSGTFPGFNVIWNGRNDRGRLIKPGMYIIIIEAENILTGLYGKKILRILVVY